MTFQKTSTVVVKKIICPRCDQDVDLCFMCEEPLDIKEYYCDCCRAMDYHMCKDCIKKAESGKLK